MSADLPERGDIVLCTVREITSHGIYVDLDEYNGMNGFLHISEISTGWVRNIERVAKVGQKLVLKVVRAERSRREVDLSLRQVTNEERRNKLIEWKQREKSMTILSMAKKKLGMDERQFSDLLAKLQGEYGTLYDALEDASKRGDKTFASMGLGPELVKELVTAAMEKIASPKYEVGSIIEMSSNAADGIAQIKKALAAGIGASSAAEIKMTYVGAPRYRVRVTADDYKQADKVMGVVLQKMEDSIGKHGSFTSKREMSRKYGGTA
ncbi:MAG: translation initiation factor IF-2 subunit alpha [Nitrososphaerota archaeon]|nr:translation initiation factor IF-2 subunit alpha [Nitrososphaerota archaeon]MDG7020608.1 translation initiation factor IF-2 subunit alpha [Nitrososphaerota archaeon]